MDDSEDERMRDSELDDLKQDENGDWNCKLFMDDTGRSALDAAIQGASLEEIRKLVEFEHKAFTSHSWMHTRSLPEAARRGQLPAVQRLLAAGAGIYEEGNSTFTSGAAMEEAARKGHLDIVKSLLEAERVKIAKDGYSPEAQQRAVDNENLDEARRLKEAKAFLEKAAESKLGALQYAAGIGNMQIARLMVDNGADVDAKPRRYSMKTALTMAAKGGHEDMVRFLLGNSAKPGGYQRDHHHPLQAAAEGGYLNVVKILLEAGYDPNADKALLAAGHAGHLPVVECLLANGADCNAGRRPLGDGELTALQSTALGGHLECVDALLRAGADIHVPAGRRGHTALQAAAKSGNSAIVQRLISSGADVNEPAEYWGRTALQAAAEIGSVEIVLMLLDAGAVVESDMNHSQSLSLELAIKGGHGAVAEMLLQEINLPARLEQQERQSLLGSALVAATRQGYEPLVRTMLELGVSVTAHDNHRNLVTIAAEAGHTSIINVLIEAGAELDGGTGRWGFTPLQNAVKGGHIDTAQFLIAAGADINLAGGRSEPPLHIAAKAKNANMFKLLLDADADIYLVSYTRKTVRQLVEKSGNEEIVRLLTEKESQVSAPAPNPDDEPFDVGDVEETIFCSECKKLPVTAFLGHNGYDFHPSLVSLRNAARSGCPFCMFFWKRIGVQTITIPQPSVCKIYQNGHSSSVWSQIEEPYPRDIECPEGLRADFTVDLEPFEDKRRPLSGDTRSPATYHQIQTWLEECCQSHSKCGNNSEATFRPSRLLDLSQWNIDRTIKLVDRKTLFESSPYVTLSYRRLAEVLASTITTSHNIASRYTSIASESLPLGFVHAIEVTLALNINYLWIDCLCIIQDSPDDWTYESSLLGKVYQNSFLTITSSASDNISEGLFRTFDTSNDCVEIPCISDLGTGETKLVRAMKHHRTWEQDYGASHLSKRGWAFQERELSTRILHYTETQVLWECREHRATEVSPTKKQLTATNSRLLDALSTATNDDDIYTLWYRTIKDYTSRHLTHETDKFPALASLAEIFATHTKSNYIAGIWEADLLHGISWIASDQYSTPRRPAARASGAYIAPTWSWASIVGSTCYKPPSAITREVQRERKPGMAVIRSHALTLETASPFGPVASASLHLCAPMITGVLGYDASSNWLGRIIQLRDLTGEEILGDMHFDVPAERGDQDIKVVRCIYLYTETLSSSRAGTSQDNECGFGLALVPVEGMVKTYRRIGPVQGLRLKYMRDVGAEEITIV